jgi:hypothetical protein
MAPSIEHRDEGTFSVGDRDGVRRSIRDCRVEFLRRRHAPRAGGAQQITQWEMDHDLQLY